MAVVTGASRGLGAALVEGLRLRGHRLGVCSSAPPSLEGAISRSVDVADPEAVEAFADEVRDRLGPIDLWINNAAVIGPVGPLRTMDQSEWDACLRVNLMGTVHGSRAFLSRCSEDGVLLNIASRAGVAGVAGLAAYSASKAAVIALTQSVAAEGGRGTATYVVVPPSVDTDMQRGLLAQDESVFPGVVQSRARQAAGRILNPDDAAAIILHSVLDSAPTGPIIDLAERYG